MEDKSLTIQPQASPVDVMIQAAITNKLDVQQFEKLIDLRERIKKDAARDDYLAALTAFQGECPVIGKSKEGGRTRAGAVAYKYAPLDVIIEKAAPLLSKNGLAYSFKVVTAPDSVEVTCVATHKNGHAEPTTMKTVLGAKTDIMSAPQQIAATVTFNKRYAFINAFGIVTGDEDDEDNLPTTEQQKPQVKPTASPKAKVSYLLKLLKEKADTEESAHASIKKLTQLDWNDANALEIVERLEVIVKQRQHADA